MQHIIYSNHLDWIFMLIVNTHFFSPSPRSTNTKYLIKQFASIFHSFLPCPPLIFCHSAVAWLIQEFCYIKRFNLFGMELLLCWPHTYHIMDTFIFLVFRDIPTTTKKVNVWRVCICGCDGIIVQHFIGNVFVIVIVVIVVAAFMTAVFVLTKRFNNESDSILLYLSTIWVHKYLA